MTALTQRLKERLKRERFQPTALGMAINPWFIIRRALHAKIADLAPQVSGRVLDFGCGSKPYRHLFPQAREYIGLDVEQSGHDHTNSQIDVFYDGKTLPFEAGSFDAVVSFETFEHVFGLPEMLVEIRRVLRPGGSLLVSTPFAWDEHEAPYDFGRYTSFGMRHLLTEAGFDVVDVSKTGNYVSAISQLGIAYLQQRVGPSRGVAKHLFQLSVIFPVTLVGVAASKILPRSDQFFHNLVTLARKRA